jgi:hypothetical protein
VLALAIAHALLIVAPVDRGVATAPAHALGEEDRRAADHYIKDGLDWTQELTSLGANLGNMLVDVLEEKQTGKVMRAEMKRVSTLIDDRLRYFRKRSSPAFTEMAAFRALFIDYLSWGARNDMLKIAEDKKRSREARGQALMKVMRAYEAEERIGRRSSIRCRPRCTRRSTASGRERRARSAAQKLHVLPQLPVGDAPVIAR